jgi:hypothetical protein
MKMLWCWRCKSEMPMLDDSEYAQVQELFRAAFESKAASMRERFKPVCDLYEQLTGMSESNPNAIMHHRISLYGPPCEQCGKPLRTQVAAFCAACGSYISN